MAKYTRRRAENIKVYKSVMTGLWLRKGVCPESLIEQETGSYFKWEEDCIVYLRGEVVIRLY